MHSKIDNFKGKQNTNGFDKRKKDAQNKNIKLKGMQDRKQKLAIRDLIIECLKAKYNFKEDSKIKEQLEIAFGKLSKKSLKEIMILHQINRSILEGDTHAFNSVINQAYGLPKQINEITGKDGEKLFPDWLTEK